MLLRVKLVTLITLKILASSVVLIIMQDDATTTDTTPSQKRETPEDAGAAEGPERRVRPRETPAGEAAAPEPEIQEGDEDATAKGESNNGDADEAKDDEDGDTVAVPEAPAPPRTAVRYFRYRGLTAAERAGRAGDPRNPFNIPRRGLPPRGLSRQELRQREAEYQRRRDAAPAARRAEAPSHFVPPRARGPSRPPDPWVREVFEVETGRVVHQETIEGEPPRNSERHEYVIPH